MVFSSMNNEEVGTYILRLMERHERFTGKYISGSKEYRCSFFGHARFPTVL